MSLVKQPGTLLSLLECPYKNCSHSQLVYKTTKLCEGPASCSHFKKDLRIQKKAVKAAKSVESAKEQD